MRKILALFLLGGFALGGLAGYLLFAPSPQPRPRIDPFAEAPAVPGPALGGTDAHSHSLAEVDPSLALPQVKAEVLPDSKGGFNLHVTASNFRFTPELAGQAPRQGEGHAHVFVNGTKVARLYGDWAYLGADNFHSGDNLVEVTLNANDHAEWVKGGEHIGASVKVRLP